MEICRSNEFFFSTRQNVRARNFGRAQSFVCQSAPDRHQARDLSRPEKITLKWMKYTLMTVEPNYFIAPARIPHSNAIIVIAIIIAMIPVN